MKQVLRQVGEKLKQQEEELIELHAENIRLKGEVHKANENIESLNRNVEIENEEGFSRSSGRRPICSGLTLSTPGLTSARMFTKEK